MLREYSSNSIEQKGSSMSPTDSHTWLSQREAIERTVNDDDCLDFAITDIVIPAPTIGAELLLSSNVEHSSDDDHDQTDVSHSTAVHALTNTESPDFPIRNDLNEHTFGNTTEIPAGKSWFRNLLTKGKKSYAVKQPKNTSKAPKNKITSDALKQSHFTDSVAERHQNSTEQELAIQRDDSMPVPWNR